MFPKEKYDVYLFEKNSINMKSSLYKYFQHLASCVYLTLLPKSAIQRRSVFFKSMNTLK